jgi:hypothetical protein
MESQVLGAIRRGPYDFDILYPVLHGIYTVCCLLLDMLLESKCKQATFEVIYLTCSKASFLAENARKGLLESPT